MSEIELSIVIPSYQEEKNLEFILPRIMRTLRAIDITSEVLVIDTIDSMDGTEGVCVKNGARYVHREGGNEYGCAIKTGIAQALGERLVFMDADGSHKPEFIEELYRNRMSYDVVIASRYVLGGDTSNRAILVFMSKLVNFAYSVVLGLNCRDVSNSFRLYYRSDLLRLTLFSKNFDIVEEMLYKLKRTKVELKILEIPYSFEQRVFGQTKRNTVTFIFSYLLTLLKLRFGK